MLHHRMERPSLFPNDLDHCPTYRTPRANPSNPWPINPTITLICRILIRWDEPPSLLPCHFTRSPLRVDTSLTTRLVRPPCQEMHIEEPPRRPVVQHTWTTSLAADLDPKTTTLQCKKFIYSWVVFVSLLQMSKFEHTSVSSSHVHWKCYTYGWWGSQYFEEHFNNISSSLLEVENREEHYSLSTPKLAAQIPSILKIWKISHPMFALMRTVQP